MSALPRLLAALLLAAGSLPALAQVLLTPGQSRQFQLPANALSTELAIDVPAGTRQLHLELQTVGNADVDLLLRFGEPFPLNGNAGVFGGLDWLAEHAHYRSISPTGSERITVSRAQHEPVRAGRWHLAVINYAGQPADFSVLATLSQEDPGPAPFTVVFDDQAGCSARGANTFAWFEATAATPVGGNPGTTVGEQRRNAFTRAMEQLRTELPGTAPVRILACWRDLGGTANSATLASAGPTAVFRDDGLYSYSGGPGERALYQLPSLPSLYTWYAGPAIAQRAGTATCRATPGNCNAPDVFIQFNSAVDGSSALGNRRFHYGYDVPPPGGNLDFIATAMHEINHGLGFFGLANTRAEQGPIGEKFRATFNGVPEPDGHNDAYTDELVVVQGNAVAPFNELPLDLRAAALTSGFNLRWADPATVEAPGNVLRPQPFPLNLPPVYAPPNLQPGSTLSHLDPNTYFSEQMGPQIVAGARALGLARPMLQAIGWNSEPLPAPQYARPFGGQWFDPARGNHGLDLIRVSGTADTYILTLYTFDANGLPEWYLAIGRIVDGVFRPGNDANGNSLWRTRYLFGTPPSQEPDTSVPGQIRIDFNQAARAPACNDGTPRTGPLALMTFTLGSDFNLRWCLQAIVPQASRPATDLTGHWAAASQQDGGWGLTTLSYGGNAGSGLFTILYFPDSQGRPRWAAAQTDTFQPGQPQPLFQLQGYCRTCPQPPGGAVPTQIGQLRIAPAANGSGTVEFNATFNGAGSTGSFSRPSIPLTRLGVSSPDGG